MRGRIKWSVNPTIFQVQIITSSVGKTLPVTLGNVEVKMNKVLRLPYFEA